MDASPVLAPIQCIVVYTADPWESALPILRYREAARMTGIKAIPGNHGPQVDCGLIDQADLVLIQRDFPRFTRAWGEVLLRARQQGKPVVYETDDLLFELSTEHPSYNDLTLYTIPLLWAIQEADLATTSTPCLAHRLQPFQANIQILPNYLNDHIWKLRPPQRSKAGDKVIIGFMGSKSHRQDLGSIVPVLQNIRQRYNGSVMLRFWGCMPPQELLGQPDVDWTPLDIQDYAQFADYFNRQHIDIAIAPLEDNLLNQAKSPIKFLEYSALGAAGVFSRLPPYASIVQDGENGYLCNHLDEWEACLAELIENPHKRLEIAAAAQETVQKGWLLSNHADQWRQTYQNIQPISDRAADALESSIALLCKSQDRILSLEAERSFSSHQVQMQQAKLQQMTTQSQTLAHELHQARSQVNTLQSELQTKQERLAQIANLLETEEDLAATRILEIMAGRTWKFVLILQKLRLLLIPNHSKREKFLKKLGIL